MSHAAEHPLLCHPARPDGSACAVTASATFTADGSLRLEYDLRGGEILWPPAQAAGPADGLWQHTCCETFIAAPDATDYREFNFSPAGQWAAYRFTAYRERDMHFYPPEAPRIEIETSTAALRLMAHLPASLLPGGNELELSLTCVIELLDQSKTYWALAHCGAQPDFHLRPSFTLTLKVPKP